MPASHNRVYFYNIFTVTLALNGARQMTLLVFRCRVDRGAPVCLEIVPAGIFVLGLAVGSVTRRLLAYMP